MDNKSDQNEAQDLKKKKKSGLRKGITIIVMIMVIIGIIEIFSFLDTQRVNQNNNSQTSTTIPSPTIQTTPTATPEPDLSARATITSIGDIILHQAVIDGGLSKDGTYQYDYIFEHIATYFNKSDYTIANYEGALNGPPYSGYPMFGGPDAIATALGKAGVDMVTTANNHAFDRGLAGLKRTPEVFAKEGIKVIGTRSNEQDPKYQIIDLNGIKTGITGYTYGTVGTETNKALNGMTLPLEANGLVDSFNPSRAAHFEKDMAEMASRIKEMKEAKAECIIFVLHWGEEYKIASNSMQQKLAQFLADQGVDVIFGHHPHVVQEISIVPSTISGKNTLVYYSLGNFLANMSFSTHDTKGYAEDALIARVTIERNKEGRVNVTTGEYIGTYVYKDRTTAKTIHKIIPIQAALLNPEQFGMQKQVALLKSATARIENVLSKSKVTQGGITIQEYTP